MPVNKEVTMIRIQTNATLAAIAASLLFAASSAQAEMMIFKTEMTGMAEVPATDSMAMGTAEVTLDTEAKTVTWSYTHDGLSGDMTAAHIHGPATATENAPPVIDTMSETMKGSGPITDAQVAEMIAGMYYFNVHTAKFPDGEIRGQLLAAP